MRQALRLVMGVESAVKGNASKFCGVFEILRGLTSFTGRQASELLGKECKQHRQRNREKNNYIQSKSFRSQPNSGRSKQEWYSQIHKAPVCFYLLNRYTSQYKTDSVPKNWSYTKFKSYALNICGQHDFIDCGLFIDNSHTFIWSNISRIDNYYRFVRLTSLSSPTLYPIVSYRLRLGPKGTCLEYRLESDSEILSEIVG